MAQNKAPFRKWVPHWLTAVAGFSILLPVILINGAYTGSSVDISSALGVLSEDISMAYYATAAGMATAYPLIPRIRPIVTTKTILLCDLILQALLSLLCARTEHMEIIMVASFCIGFLKAFAMLEMIVILKPIFSRNNIRSEFYAYFYPIVFGMGQLSMLLTSELAYNYQWQYMYYLVMVLLLLAIIVVLICFRYGRRPIRIPFRDIDKRSVLWVSTLLLSLTYVCTYGKTRDWFASWNIVVGCLWIPLAVWLFVRRQRKTKTPYVNLAVLQSTKAIVGYFFMAVVMVLSASSALVSSYATSVLKVDSIHANGLNLVMIPGFILSAIVCFWWFRLQVWRFRVLISWGMACFSGYFALLYFGISAEGTYEFLYLPMFLRGAGMMILFIAFGVYAVEDLDPKLMISNAFFLVGVRSLVAPVIGASLFSNLLYRTQQQSLMVLGEGIDLQNPLAASPYQDALNGALHQGLSMGEAQQTAVNSLYALLNVQSLILSLKIIVGYLLIFSLLLMIATRFIPFHKTLKTKVVRSGDDMA